MSVILSYCRVILIALFAGEEPTNEQSYRYLTNDGDFKLQDDSHDMDPTTEKKNSTMSRAGDESTYGADTLERTMIRCAGETYVIQRWRNLNQNIVTRAEQKDRVDSSRYMDNSHYVSDNMPLSAPPVNAG